jgi:hypothetical protein
VRGVFIVLSGPHLGHIRHPSLNCRGIIITDHHRVRGDLVGFRSGSGFDEAFHRVDPAECHRSGDIKYGHGLPPLWNCALRILPPQRTEPMSDAHHVLRIVKPSPSDLLEAYPVLRKFDIIVNNGPDLVAPSV